MSGHVRAPRITAATPPSEWPLYLTVHEVALLKGCSRNGLLNQCGKGTAWPPPVADEHGFIKPYRFDRAVVAGALSGALPRPARLVSRTRTSRRFFTAARRSA